MSNENPKIATIVCVFLVVIICVLIAVVGTDKKSDFNKTDKFEILYNGEVDGMEYYIVHDKDTGVEYYMPSSGFNKGSLSVLYDTDGKVLLYGVGE